MEKEDASWNAAEIEELLESIENLLPKTDTVPINRRTKKIPWDDVEVTGRSVEECRTQWKTILTKVRTYRIAAEVIADARQLLVCQLDKSQKPPLLPKRLQHRVTGYGRSSHRHPDYPKLPISPYVIFFNQKLAEVRAEHADWNMREIHRYIGDLYRLLPESAPLLKKNEEDKANFHSAKRKFYDDHPELLPISKREKVLVKNDGAMLSGSAPLSPVSSFARFCKSVPELSRKQARVKWDKLIDEEKLIHIDAAVQDQDRYKAEVEKYNKKYPEQMLEKSISQLTRSDKEIFEKLRTSPNEQRPSEPLVPEEPYQLFLTDFLQRLENKNDSNWMTTASLAWKNIGIVGQREYSRRIKKIWDKYRRELDDYRSTAAEPEDSLLSSTKTTPHRSQSSRTGENKMSVLKRKRQKIRDKEVPLAADSDSVEKASSLKGLELFIFENERDVLISFPAVGERNVRHKLEKMFESLSSVEQEAYNAKALRFEDDFYR